MGLCGMSTGCSHMTWPLSTACLVPLSCLHGKRPLEIVFTVSIWNGELKQYQGTWGVLRLPVKLPSTCLPRLTQPSLSFPAERLDFIILGLVLTLGSRRTYFFCFQVPVIPTGFLFFHANSCSYGNLPTIYTFCLPRLEVVFPEGIGLPQVRDWPSLLCCFEFPGGGVEGGRVQSDNLMLERGAK